MRETLEQCNQWELERTFHLSALSDASKQGIIKFYMLADCISESAQFNFEGEKTNNQTLKSKLIHICIIPYS